MHWLELRFVGMNGSQGDGVDLIMKSECRKPIPNPSISSLKKRYCSPVMQPMTEKATVDTNEVYVYPSMSITASSQSLATQAAASSYHFHVVLFESDISCGKSGAHGRLRVHGIYGRRFLQRLL